MDSGVDFSSDELRSGHKSSSNESIAEEPTGVKTPVVENGSVKGQNGSQQGSIEETHTKHTGIFEQITEFVTYAQQKLISEVSLL